MKMQFNPGEGGDESFEFAKELGSAFGAAMSTKPAQVGKAIELMVPDF